MDQYDLFFLLCVADYGWRAALELWDRPCVELKRERIHFAEII